MRDQSEMAIAQQNSRSGKPDTQQIADMFAEELAAFPIHAKKSPERRNGKTCGIDIPLNKFELDLDAELFRTKVLRPQAEELAKKIGTRTILSNALLAPRLVLVAFGLKDNLEVRALPHYSLSDGSIFIRFDVAIE